MKKIMIATLVTLAAQVLSAQSPIPGFTVVHNMSCVSADKNQTIYGVDYRMKCYTQALAPEMNLKKCEIYKQIVVPNSTPQKIELAIQVQTSKSAYLSNDIEKIKVSLNKNNFKAHLELSNNLKFICKPTKINSGAGMSAGN